jgi:cobalt-zinc-cadmium resistance protein CzcA
LPIAVKDVANVKIGGELRTGAASHERPRSRHRHRVDADRREQPRRRAQCRARDWTGLSKSLPPGIKVTPVLDRSKLVNATIATVQRNLIEGAILVAIALFLLLGNVRADLIAVLIIPDLVPDDGHRHELPFACRAT